METVPILPQATYLSLHLSLNLSLKFSSDGDSRVGSAADRSKCFKGNG